MKRRDAIFDRLALKEKLFIKQQMRNLGALSSELQKLENMRLKLTDMAAKSAPKRMTSSGRHLRAGLANTCQSAPPSCL